MGAATRGNGLSQRRVTVTAQSSTFMTGLNSVSLDGLPSALSMGAFE